ncbi:MAG: hypothetical protein AB1531_05590, partial [Chloroflexota bacterium]
LSKFGGPERILNFSANGNRLDPLPGDLLQASDAAPPTHTKQAPEPDWEFRSLSVYFGFPK